MTKIYICGRVTGDPNYKTKFNLEENRLRLLGWEPVNPAALIAENEPWNYAMRAAIREMLLCEYVDLLPDWKKSKGAKIEVELASKVGMRIKDSASIV